MLHQLQEVHRLLYMYLKQARFEGVDGDAVMLAVDDKERLDELEQGVTQYGESLRRYLPNFFGAQAYCVVRTGIAPAVPAQAPTPVEAAIPVSARDKPQTAASDPPAASLAAARASGDPEIMLRAGLKVAHTDLQRGEGFELLGDAFCAQHEEVKALSMWAQAGEAFLIQGKADKTAELVIRVLKAQPQHSVALRLWERLPASVKGKTGFQSAAHLDAMALVAQAEQEVYQAKKHLDQAIVHYRQAVKQAPDDATLKDKLKALYQWMAEA